jgi:hypothetical protein
VTHVEVTTESLRRAARELTGVAESTDATLQSFHSRIEALGQPWGDDDLGMAIGTVYQGALAMVMNCFVSNLDTVDGYSQRLGIAAEDYDATDLQAAAGLDGIAGNAPNVAI